MEKGDRHQRERAPSPVWDIELDLDLPTAESGPPPESSIHSPQEMAENTSSQNIQDAESTFGAPASVLK